MLFFIGLALDAGSLYVTYGNLKRAVDSAAVAAANEFKRDADVDAMILAANEVLGLMNVDYTNLELRLCDGDDPGRERDLDLPPIFEARCPDTANGEESRKLVWVKAEQQAPLYFLSLLGFNNLMISTNTISEAAPLDVVIVLDTSESMAWSSQTPGYVSGTAFNPGACNGANTCQPMKDAKAAAKALIGTLADGYDQVAIVTYDTEARVVFSLGGNLSDAEDAIDTIGVHDDPPVGLNVWVNWYLHAGSYNPMNSEDLDGDGLDADNPAILGYTCPFATNPGVLDDRWWTVGEGAPDPYGWGGVPCDRDDVYDSMNWDTDTIWTMADHDAAQAWANAALGGTWSGVDDYKFTALSTCSGCGLRTGANELKSGRFGAVWVMVFLSDGAVNLSDAPPPNYAGNTFSGLPNGFCHGSLGKGYWKEYCFDNTFTPRYCFDSDSATCPPGSVSVTIPPPVQTPPIYGYSVLDYALDMVDETALTQSTNVNEPKGNEIAIYSIGLNVDSGVAEKFLRYMAAVGDDGDRNTDPCSTASVNTSCGQYYYAPTGDRLLPIFEDIASRIYTRISQ